MGGIYRGSHSGVGTIGYGSGFGSPNPLGLQAPNFTSFRKIATLNGLSQYLTLPVINLTPSDVLTVEFIAGTATAANDYILSGLSIDAATDVVLLTNASGLINFGGGNTPTVTLDGNAITSLSTALPSDGLKHVLTYQPSNNQRFVNFGVRFSISNFLAASPIGIRVNDGSVYNYPIDDNNPVIRNEAATLGSEQVVNGTFDTNLDNWVNTTGAWSWENGRAKVVNADSPIKSLSQDGVFTIGVTYLIEFDIEVDTGTIGFQDGANQLVISGGTGHYKIAWTADTTSLYFKRGSTVGTGYIANITVRQADGYGALVNGTAATWEDKPV